MPDLSPVSTPRQFWECLRPEAGNLPGSLGQLVSGRLAGYTQIAVIEATDVPDPNLVLRVGEHDATPLEGAFRILLRVDVDGTTELVLVLIHAGALVIDWIGWEYRDGDGAHKGFVSHRFFPDLGSDNRHMQPDRQARVLLDRLVLRLQQQGKTVDGLTLDPRADAAATALSKVVERLKEECALRADALEKARQKQPIPPPPPRYPHASTPRPHRHP